MRVQKSKTCKYLDAGKRGVGSDESDMEIVNKRLKTDGLKINDLGPFGIYGVKRGSDVIYGLYDPTEKKLIHTFKNDGFMYEDSDEIPLSDDDVFVTEDEEYHDENWYLIKNKIKKIDSLKVTKEQLDVFAKQLAYVDSLPDIVQSSLDPGQRNFMEIWPILRGNSGTEEGFMHIKNIDSAFENVPPLEQDITVYRSVRAATEDDLYKKIIEDINVVGATGEFMYDRAYVSTSLYRDYSLSFQNFLDTNKCCFFIIKIPKGSKVLLLPATLETQFEVLINRGALFKKGSSFSIGGQIKGFYLDYIKSIPDDINEPPYDFNVFSTIEIPNILALIKGPYYIMGGKCFNAYFKNKTETSDWDLTMGEKEKEELLEKLEQYAARKQIKTHIKEYERFNTTQIGFEGFDGDNKFIIDIHNEEVTNYTELPYPVLVVTGVKKKIDSPLLVESTGRKTTDVLLKFMTLQMFVEDIIQTYDNRSEKYFKNAHFINKYFKTRDRIYEVVNISSDNISVSYQVYLLNQCKNTLRRSKQIIPLFKISDTCYANYNCGTVEVIKDTSTCIKDNPYHEKIRSEETRALEAETEARKAQLLEKRKGRLFEKYLVESEPAAKIFEIKKNEIDATSLEKLSTEEKKKELLRLGPSWFINIFKPFTFTDSPYMHMPDIEDIHKKQLTNYFRLLSGLTFVRTSKTDTGCTIVIEDHYIIEVTKISNIINITMINNSAERKEMICVDIDFCLEEMKQLYFSLSEITELPTFPTDFYQSIESQFDIMKNVEQIVFNSTLIPTSLEDVNEVRSYLVQKVKQVQSGSGSIYVYFIGPEDSTPGYNRIFTTKIYDKRVFSATPSGYRRTEYYYFKDAVNQKIKLYFEPYNDYRQAYNYFYNDLIDKLTTNDKLNIIVPDLGYKRNVLKKAYQPKNISKRKPTKRKSIKKSCRTRKVKTGNLKKQTKRESPQRRTGKRSKRKSPQRRTVSRRCVLSRRKKTYDKSN